MEAGTVSCYAGRRPGNPVTTGASIEPGAWITGFPAFAGMTASRNPGDAQSSSVVRSFLRHEARQHHRLRQLATRPFVFAPQHGIVTALQYQMRNAARAIPCVT